MLHFAHTTSSHRDGFSFVIGVYALMALGVLFGTLMLLSTTLALAWYMLTSNHYHLTGLAMLFVLVAIGTLTGSWMLHCVVGLWAHKSSARAETVILSTVLSAVSILMISALKVSYLASSKLGAYLIAVGIGVAVTGAITAWVLARPTAQQYFRRIH